MENLVKCTKKYQKALLLVKEESIEQIKKEIVNCTNLIFVKSLDEFRENVDSNFYLAISISITNYNSVVDMIKQFPNCIFHRVIELPGSWPLENTFEISNELNVAKDIYLPFDLINHIKTEVQLDC